MSTVKTKYNAPAGQKPSSNTTGSAKYNTGAQTEAWKETTYMGKYKTPAREKGSNNTTCYAKYNTGAQT